MSVKKHYMILDTETASTATIPFDIACTIVDRAGNVVGQVNYLVGEVFNSPLGRHLVMFDDYSKNKASKYLDLMESKQAVIADFALIREKIRLLVKDFNCTVVAYNAKFDFECLTNFAQSFGFEDFFTPETEVWDLWNIALSILADSGRYVKFCNEHDYKSDKGNLKSSAEIMYRYLTNDLDFTEEHTALADTEIEAAILLACLKRHKKLQTAFIKQVFRHPVWKERCQA